MSDIIVTINQMEYQMASQIYVQITYLTLIHARHQMLLY